MFCKNCGSQLEENNKFCGNCGTPVEQKSTQETSVQVEQTPNEVNTQSFETSSNTTSNNNLKNALIILLICLVVGGIAVLGYSMLFKKTGADAIDYALNNMTDMNNFKLNVSIDVDTNYEDEQISVSANANAIIDIKNKMASLNMNATTSGVTIEIPAYADLNNNYVYFKIPMQDEDWYKMNLANYLNEDIDLEENNTRLAIEDYLRNDEFIEKASSNEKNIDHYVLHFTKDVLKKLSEDEDNDFDYEMLEEIGLSEGFDLNLYINTKNNYITKIEFDLSGKTINEMTFDKLKFTIEITDVNTSEKIVIPNEALNAKDIEEMEDYDYDIDEIEEDTYIEDYKLTYGGHTISYNLPEGYEASSVNSSDFKIYRKNGMRVIMSIDYDTKDSFFEEVEGEKTSAEEYGYTNVQLSDIKELSYEGKTFYYKALTYDTTYGKNYEAYLCYELDGEYVYSVTYEDEDNVGSVTEESMKDFLNITVN